MTGLQKLGDLAEITAGPSGSLLDHLSDEIDGIPVVSPSNLTEDRRVDPRRLRRVPVDIARKLGRFQLEVDDILAVRQGSLGRIALVDADSRGWLYGTSLLRIRIRHDLVSPPYLATYLGHPRIQRHLLRRTIPGTVPSLNTAILAELEVAVPPRSHQDALAEVTSDIDEQVRGHQAVAGRLRNLRSALFDHLFPTAEQG